MKCLPKFWFLAQPWGEGRAARPIGFTKAEHQVTFPNVRFVTVPQVENVFRWREYIAQGWSWTGILRAELKRRPNRNATLFFAYHISCHWHFEWGTNP